MQRSAALGMVVLFAAGVVLAVAACGSGTVAGAISSVATGTRSLPTATSPGDAVDETVAAGPTTVTETTESPTVTQEATVTHATTVEQTVATTVATTVTTPAPAIVPATTTAPTEPATTAGDSDGGVAPIWIVLGLGLVAAAIGILVSLLRRRKTDLAPGERHRRLASVVDTWTAQGWAIERREDEQAVLVNGTQRMLVAVDANGRVSSSPLAAV